MLSQHRHLADITWSESGVPWHPGAMHPSFISLVAGPYGLSSDAAHLLIASPSMPGVWSTAIPYMIPVRDIDSARSSCVGSLSESSFVSSSGSDSVISSSLMLLAMASASALLVSILVLPFLGGFTLGSLGNP